MLILDVISIIFIVIAVYSGGIHRNPAKAKPIHWAIIAAALVLITVSEGLIRAGV